MSVNKSFIVKKGIEVSNDLIFANDELNKVGIGSTVPKGKLDVSGDTRTKDLNVSGIATISIITGTIGTVTNLTGTNINYTGIGTFANLVGTSGTVVNIVGSSLNYGIGTFVQLNSDKASLYENSGTFFDYTGFGTVTNLRSLSGIVTNLSGTNLNYTGIGTFANLDGTSATITNLTGTSGTVTRLLGTNLNFSGVGTINNVRIVSGIVTAVSGIITFYGDGSNLTSVKPVPAGAGDREVQFNISGITTASSNLRFVNDNELLVGNRVTSQYIGVGTVVVDNSLSVGGFTTFFSFGNKFLEITPTQNTIQIYSQNYQNERRRWLTYPFKPYIHTLGDLSTKQSLLITEIDWVISNYPVTTTSTVGTLQDNSGFTTSITAAYGYNTDTDIVLHNRLFLGGRHPRASDDDECGLWISPGGILGDGNNASNSSGPIANRPVIDTYFGDDTTVGSLSARMRLSGYVKGAGSNGAEFASINFDSQISPDNQFNFQRGKAKIWAKNVIDLTNPKAQYGSSLVFGASKLGPQNSGQNSSTYSDILEIRGDDYLRLLPNITGIQFAGTQNAINYDGSNNIRIVTNSTERVAITSTGRIGIGVTIPATSTLVSIAGSFGFSEPGSTGSRTRFTSSSAGFILNHDDNSNLFFQTQGLTRFRWDHNAIAFIIGSIQPTGTANQRFQVEGGAYFQNGVGIGTTNPGESLEVAGNIRVGSSSTQNYIAFRGTTGDNQPELGGPFNHSFIGERVWDPNTERSELVIIKTNDPGGVSGPDRIRLVGAEIKFDTYTTGYAGSFQEVATSPNNLNRFVIKSDGTIGIGTETTKALLDVRGQATFGEGVVPTEMGWGKDANERVYSFSGSGGTNPSQGTIALVSPNVNPSATRVGGLVFGNRIAANPATTNAGIKAVIETFTNTNVANASDTGGYLNVRVKPNAGNLYTIATFDSSKLQVFGHVESSRLISNVASGTSPLVVSSTTQVNNLNSQYVNGKSVGTSGNTIPLLDGNNTWSGLNTFNRELNVVSGNNAVTLGLDGNIEITRDGNGAYIDFKNANEDFDVRIQRTGDDELSIIGGQLTTGKLRMTDDSGIDAGKSLFFGREESFFGNNIGGNDYGYIIWDNDNNDYAAWGDSGENGCLRIGTENDGDNSVSDSMALEPVADLWLYPRLGRVHFHKKNSANGGQRVFTGLDAPSSASGRGQFVLSSAYSDLVIASSQSNSQHGSTLTFATYSPSDSSIYRKFVINQGNWGSRAGFLEFGFSDANSRSNPHSNINDSDTVLTLDGYNKRVGIGRRSPGSTLDVLGESRFTADNAIVATGTNPTDDVWGGSIEIREINQVLNTNTASAYAPAITFHWGNVTSSAIKMYSDGSIRFTAQGSGGTSYRPIYASQFISNVGTGTAPLVVSSTTKVNNLNADLLDGYDSSNFINSTHTGFSAVLNRPVGWYTIAVNIGNRAVARFGIKDVQSSQHQSVIFYASHKFGNFSELTVLHGSRYYGNPFRYIRIKEGSTYDGALLQVYIDDPSNAVTAYLLGDNFQDSSWTLVNWIPDGTNPGGVANFGALTNTAAQIDIDQILDGGMATTGDIYAGGQTEQFRVLTTNDLGPSKGLNADLLDNHDWMSAGKNIRGSEIYADSWIRNYNSGTGFYNEATAMHWYSDASWRWRLYSTSSAAAILFATAGNNPRGYVYADTASSIGFLNTGGEWGLRYLSNDGLSPNLYFLESGNESWSGDPGSDVGKIEYHSNRFYIASGDNSTEIARFRRSGTDRVVIQNDGTTLINGYRVLTTADEGHTNGLDADTLDGYQASAFHLNGSGNAMTCSEAYIYNWVRTYDEEGLYSQSYGQHFYPDSGGFYWEVDGPLRIRNGYEGGIQGYVGYHDANGFGLLHSGGSWWLNTQNNDAHLVIGGSQAYNAYSSVTGRRLMFGGGDADAQSNYYIGTNLENYNGNYNKLDLRWHTGIRIGAQAVYGGVRIFDSEDLGTRLFSVGEGDNNVRVTNSIFVSTANGTGNGIILADDGDIVDLNDGFASMRFSNGVRVYSGNRTGSARITLGSNGTVSATKYTGDGSELTGIIGKAAAMALIFG